MTPGSTGDAPRRSLWKNWISLAGLVAAAGALLAFLLLYAIDFLAHGENPYLGLLTYLVVPSFLVGGLVLAALGALWQRRQLRKDPTAAPPRLSIDLGRRRDRQALLWFGLATSIFLLLTSIGSYEAYHVAESNAFCGAVCHTVMEPQYAAFQHGPHAGANCVDCHIGSGVGPLLASKLNGTRQLYSVLLDRYERPIPTPVHNLRAAKDTCEGCHTARSETGDVYRSYVHFLGDDENTPYTVRMLLHVGGGRSGKGIHWHMKPENRVEYWASDERRQVIPWVRVTDERGTRVFRTEDHEGEPPAAEIRTMDCIDCHNRPGHAFETPNDAVERAIAENRVDGSLPGVKRKLVDILAAPYVNRTEAVAKIRAAVKQAYLDRPAILPEGAVAGEEAAAPVAAAARPSFEQSAEAVVAIYQASFFPEMKADWRGYPDNVGHKDWPGCLRCHDRQHQTDGDEPVKLGASDCKSCHTILAQGGPEDLAEVSMAGVKFDHPDGPVGKGLCSDCHNGMSQEK